MKGIKGSGPNGRIVAKDLEGVEPQAAAAAAPAAAATAGAAQVPLLPTKISQSLL